MLAYKPFLIAVGMLCSAHVAVFSQLAVYPGLPNDRQKSQQYNIKIAEADESGQPVGSVQTAYTYQLLRSEAAGSNNTDILSDNHWLTFSFSPTETAKQVRLEISKTSGTITKAEFRPSTNINGYSISGGKLYVTMGSDKMVSVFINDDIKQPLFLFSDPKEQNVPDTTRSDVWVVKGTSIDKPLRIANIPNGTKVVYFGPGIHYMYDKADPISSNGGGLVITTDGGIRTNNNVINQVYIAGGAYVVGAIRAPKVSNLTVNGRGIIAGQFEGIPYCEQGNKYLEDRIYNSAIVMADYNSKTDRKQLVDGLTIILPIKYSIQVGAYATVRNTKCFAFHQTTDGIGAEANAKIYNNFLKVNDDMIKIYNDNMEVRNTYFWHQNNGACFQFGWNESQGKNCVIKNTFLIRDDAADSYMNESHWDNHSFIDWHSTGYTNTKPVHEGHLFDSINAVGMPQVKVWRFMAINLNGKYPAGSLGGILKNLQIKNVNLGPEKLASYIGATINGSTADVNFTNAKLGGICINKTNIIQDGTVTVTPTTNICVAATTPPAAPTGFKITNTTYKTISLTWTDNSDLEENFVLEQSLSENSGWAVIANPTESNYLDINLNAETTYYYRVKAVNSIGSSDYIMVSGRTNAAPSVVPAKATNVVALAENDRSISLKWADNATDEDAYLVQQLVGTDWQTMLTLNPGATSALIKGLTPETTYSFRVLATNIVGLSEPSETASATTKSGFNAGILSNGSFEDGTIFTEEGSWTLQPGNVTSSNDVAKSGLLSAKFQNPGSNYIEPEFNLKALFACYGAGTYNVTMSVFVPATNTGKVELYFTPQNVYFQPGSVRDQWVTLTQKVNYTAGAEIKLKAKTYNGPTGAMFYVDDIAITTTNTKCTGNAVQQNPLAQIQLYPNPANNVLYIRNPISGSNLMIRILSVNGQTEFVGKSSATMSVIDLTKLSKGLKIAELCDEKGNMHREKLIIK